MSYSARLSCIKKSAFRKRPRAVMHVLAAKIRFIVQYANPTLKIREGLREIAKERIRRSFFALISKFFPQIVMGEFIKLNVQRI